jgi:hypothetical protein
VEAPGERRVHEEEPTAPQAEPDLVARHNAYAALSQQQEAPSSDGDVAPPLAESTAADERQERLRAVASALMYWKGGL